MSNRKASFELHIAINAYAYSDDWHATVTVVYPACGSQPAMAQAYEAEYEYEAISKATKDIEAFLSDTDKWIADYVKQSTETGRKLAYAREQLTAHQERAASYRRQAEVDEKHVERYRQEIAQLEEVQE